MKRCALIDADSIIFKAGCANETREYQIFDGDTIVHTCKYKKESDGFMHGNPDLVLKKTKYAGELSHSLANAGSILESILDRLPHASHRVFIKGEGNFRFGLYPEYKAQRDPDGKPIHEQEIREYLIKYKGAETVDGEEVDDKVSYLQCADLSTGCIVAVDKDLWNTPGEHFNYDTGVLEFVTHEQANYNFWKQMLTGDRSDNVPGLHGIGPATAVTLLKGMNANHGKEVLQAYRAAKKPLSYFTLMGRLLWMRRKPGEFWDLNAMRTYEVPK